MTDFHLIGTDTQFVSSYSFSDRRKKGAHHIHPTTLFPLPSFVKIFRKSQRVRLKTRFAFRLKLYYLCSTKSNLYTLIDIPDMWGAETEEQMKELAELKIELTTEEMLAELERRGIKIIKEKEPESTEPTKDQLNQALELNQFDIVNTTINSQKSQEIEKYSLEQIQAYYEYDVMIHDNPYQKNDIDSIMSILHTALNTSKPTIRIAGEEKPSMAVAGKLMKLTYSGIMYAIGKYKEQTERIKNPTAYMLTLLYNAEEQMNLDIANQVQHDMNKWKEEN